MTAQPQPARSTALINALMAERGGARRFVYRGPVDDSDQYRVEVDGRRREGDVDAMAAWLEWFNIGTDTAKVRRRTRPAPIDEIRAVLVAPTLADALRTEIRYRMEQAGIGRDRLAEQAGRSTKAVTDALKYGTPGGLSAAMVTSLGAVLDLDVARWLAEHYADVPLADVWHSAGWDMRYVRRVGVGGPVAPLADAPREPAPLRRLRAVAVFHDRGLLTLISPLEPNRALRVGAFTVARARRERVIRAEVLYSALTGLADAVDPPAADLILT